LEFNIFEILASVYGNV